MKVIADIGSNWNSLDDCLKSVEICKESSIDIVKFQYFTHEKLYGFPGKMEGELPKEWIPEIHSKCIELGIEFMCSVFDPDDVEFIDKFVEAHKIASPEALDLDLVTKAINTQKHTLISLGCSQESIYHEERNIVPMACISDYPTNLYPIEQLSELFSRKSVSKRDIEFGLSDHNLNPFGYELAYRFGCEYYEFHFNPLKIVGKPDECVSRTEFYKPVIEPFKKKLGRKFLRPYPMTR